jgi:mannosyltransferase OCH1-like enzyme
LYIGSVVTLLEIPLKQQMKIHYLWMQGIEHAPHHTQQRLSHNAEVWKSWGHDVGIWSDVEIQALIKKAYPAHRLWYNSILNGIQRCDVARAFLLHTYGGLYTDIDYDPLIDPPITDEASVIVGSDALMGANNAWIYSPPQHAFWFDHYIPHVRQQLLGPRLWDTFVALVIPNWTIVSTTGPLAYWQLRRHLVLEPRVYTEFGKHGEGSSPTWFNKYANSQQSLLMILTLILALFGAISLYREAC